MDNKNYHWCKTSTKNKRINYYQQNVGNYKEDLRRNKVGIILVNYHPCGGVKTWCENLIPIIKDSTTGIGCIDTPDESISELGIPFGNSESYLKNLCEKSDIILAWGFSNIKKYSPKRTIFVHHGDETNKWSINIIKNLDVIPEKIVSVNPIVAKQNGYHYIPNCVTENRCSKTIDRKSNTVLWGHRFTPEKRPELAIEIAKVMPDFKFLFCGNMPTEDHLNQINSLQNAQYLGIKKNLSSLFEISSVFLSTSEQESYGYSVAEAIRSGLPVVSTNTGIAKDLADIKIEGCVPMNWAKAIRLCSGSFASGKEKIKDLNSNLQQQWRDLLC
jgi:glycosyltransferase involved in cell wall biosynthesis